MNKLQKVVLDTSVYPVCLHLYIPVVMRASHSVGYVFTVCMPYVGEWVRIRLESSQMWVCCFLLSFNLGIFKSLKDRKVDCSYL